MLSKSYATAATPWASRAANAQGREKRLRAGPQCSSAPATQAFRRTILPALTYGAIVVLYLSVRKRLEKKEGGFSLGRFELPVAIAALIWVAFAVFVLVTPEAAFVPTLVVIGLVLAGGIYVAYMMIVNREVLETEPGEQSFAVAPETAT